MQMTAVGSNLDMEEIMEASWSLFQLDCAAAFKLSKRSPLPPALSAKDLPGGRTQILNVCQIRWITHHPVEDEMDSTPECGLDREHWLNRNGDSDNPNDCKDNMAPEFESDIDQDNGIDDRECLEQRDVSAGRNVPRLIRPTRK